MIKKIYRNAHCMYNYNWKLTIKNDDIMYKAKR